MERGSDKHSPRIDENLDAATRSLVQGAPVESRAEEYREQEGPGDGEPLADNRLTGDRGVNDEDTLRYDEVEARSELARYLEPSVFPTDREGLIASAERMHAPDDLLSRLRELPEGVFTHTEAVWEALGGRVEFRA